MAVSNVNADYKLVGSEKYINVNATVAVTCNVSMDVLNAIGVAKSIELAKVPIAAIGYATLTLDLSLEGELTLNMVENISMGVQYQNETFNLTRSFKHQSFTIQAKAKASAGVCLSAGVNVVVFSGKIYGKTGATATAQIDSYSDGKTPSVCSHVCAWMYASIGCNVTLDLFVTKKTWSKEVTIFDASNSPIRVAYHYEDGTPVSECTRDKERVEAGGSPKYKFYTSADSRYGYNGASSGIGSNGETYTIFNYEVISGNNIQITGYYGNVSALTIPGTLDGYKVVQIGSSAFKGNTNIRYVGIPDGVTEIGSNAFYGCSNLASVSMTDSVTVIGSSAFSNCTNLSNVSL